MKVEITYPVIRYNTIDVEMTEAEKEDFDNLNDEDKARFIKDKNDDQVLPEQTSIKLIEGVLDLGCRMVRVAEEVVPVTSHTEYIECPNCQHRQYATIDHTVPFNTCIHICESCEYLIMESEWNVVDEAEQEHPLHPPITEPTYDFLHPSTGTFRFP